LILYGQKHESDSIKPKFQGGSPLALETKVKRNKNAYQFNNIKNQTKQIIFESDIKGNIDKNLASVFK
jgi:hypothetical protein